MTWQPYYHGTGEPRETGAATIPDPPPWRRFPRKPAAKLFQASDELIEMVNAALALRRPLFVSGPPGSGKSTVIESVAGELGLGKVLRWHITSRSTVTEALYRYDVLGRMHAQNIDGSIAPIEEFMQLGPLGTALLGRGRPRALLIDEIDKSDLDLPGDLLEVLERGEFEIPELVRLGRTSTVPIRMWNDDNEVPITGGVVSCTDFPFIVMTSNGDRDFPPPFLRRCLRYEMKPPSAEMLKEIVEKHLEDVEVDSYSAELIRTFADRLEKRQLVAIDQLLNAVFVLTGDDPPMGTRKDEIVRAITRELTSN